jgi:hypothetical protein
MSCIHSNLRLREMRNHLQELRNLLILVKVFIRLQTADLGGGEMNMEGKNMIPGMREAAFELIDIREIPDDQLDDLLGGAGSITPNFKVG